MTRAKNESTIRFNTFSQFLKQNYSYKVFKAALNAGFTCPNRDGTKGEGGCTYCLNSSFSPHADSRLSLAEQFKKTRDFYKNKYPACKFIIYLQAYTNTYAPLMTLKKIYDEVVSYPDVVGLSIGTRPDCLSNQTLDLIESYASRVRVWLEIGLESTHNKSLKNINRCHTYEDFLSAVERAEGRGFRIATHTIFGLPGESHTDMMLSVNRISKLNIDDIKIHHLYVSPNTEMEKDYREGKIELFSYERWIKTCSDIIEQLNPKIVIQRVVGELSGPGVIAPLWGVAKSQIISDINNELARRGLCQGSKFLESSNQLVKDSQAAL